MVALLFVNMYRFFLGAPLDSVADGLLRLHNLCIDYGQLGCIFFSSPLLQTCYNLMGRTSDPLVLKGDAMNEEDLRNRRDDGGKNIYGLSLFFKLHIAVYMNELEFAAGPLSAETKTNMEPIVPFTAKHHAFLESIVAEAPYRANNTNSVLPRWKHKKRLKRLKEAALLCPENFGHKLYLVQAEQAVSQGQFDLAVHKYEKSIRQAEKEGIPSDQGLACERAARMFLSLGKKKEATRHISQALNLYKQWGAKVKVDQLKRLVTLEKLDLK